MPAIRTSGADQTARRPVLHDITVVIPTLGRPILKDCLRSIASASAWPARLVVVDQSASGKVDEWIAQVRKLGLESEHVPSRQRGRAAGVNRGIERATTRFVAVTDDDCLVEPDWLAELTARLRANPEAIVTGRVDPAGDEVVLAVRPSREPAVYRRPRLRFDSMCGGNMGAAREVLERVGMFDEDPRVRCSEDGEFAYRALRSGVPIIYVPEAAVSHFGWRDAADRSEQYRAYAYSLGGFYGKYLRRGDWFIALRAILHHFRSLVRWVRGTVTSDPDMAGNGRAYLLGTLPGMMAGLRRESGAEATRAPQ